MNKPINMRRHIAWEVYRSFRSKGITKMGQWRLYEDGIIDPGNMKHNFNPINIHSGLQEKCISSFYKVNPK